MKERSPVFRKSLLTLPDDDSADFGEVFYIHFNMHWDKNDLIPNGSCITVVQTNRTDYFYLCQIYFQHLCKGVYEEFQKGFNKLCDKEITEFFFSILKK